MPSIMSFDSDQNSTKSTNSKRNRTRSETSIGDSRNSRLVTKCRAVVSSANYSVNYAISRVVLLGLERARNGVFITSLDYSLNWNRRFQEFDFVFFPRRVSGNVYRSWAWENIPRTTHWGTNIGRWRSRNAFPRFDSMRRTVLFFFLAFPFYFHFPPLKITDRVFRPTIGALFISFLFSFFFFCRNDERTDGRAWRPPQHRQTPSRPMSAISWIFSAIRQCHTWWGK